MKNEIENIEEHEAHLANGLSFQYQLGAEQINEPLIRGERCRIEEQVFEMKYNFALTTDIMKRIEEDHGRTLRYIDRLRLYCKKNDHSLQYYENAIRWNKTKLNHRINENEDNMKQLINTERRYFKRSMDRYVESQEFFPVNLHLQRMLILGLVDETPQYDIGCVGAFTCHTKSKEKKAVFFTAKVADLLTLTHQSVDDASIFEKSMKSILNLREMEFQPNLKLFFSIEQQLIITQNYYLQLMTLFKHFMCIADTNHYIDQFREFQSTINNFFKYIDSNGIIGKAIDIFIHQADGTKLASNPPEIRVDRSVFLDSIPRSIDFITLEKFYNDTEHIDDTVSGTINDTYDIDHNLLASFTKDISDRPKITDKSYYEQLRVKIEKYVYFQDMENDYGKQLRQTLSTGMRFFSEYVNLIIDSIFYYYTMVLHQHFPQNDALAAFLWRRHVCYVTGASALACLSQNWLLKQKNPIHSYLSNFCDVLCSMQGLLSSKDEHILKDMIFTLAYDCSSIICSGFSKENDKISVGRLPDYLRELFPNSSLPMRYQYVYKLPLPENVKEKIWKNKDSFNKIWQPTDYPWIKIAYPFSFRVVPTFFNIGINEHGGNDLMLLANGNLYGFSRFYYYLKNYYRTFNHLISVIDKANFKPLFSKVLKERTLQSYKNNESNFDTEIRELTLLLEESSKQARHVEYLEKTFELSTYLNPILTISCKSAKDRTAMGVTLEMGRFLQRDYNFSQQTVTGLIDYSRQYGTRRRITQKNANMPTYSFNIYQLWYLPDIYKPPKSTCSSGMT
ncbi:hypothetical protein SNEBB_007839 [Seison nebaliae]|nr:hypothetical protein SNEBB_007839 [Seison nebaliae]